MSRSLDIAAIIERIKVATEHSPIAVFKSRYGLDAVFGNTATTQDMMVNSDAFVGLYHKDMNLDRIYIELGKAERGHI